MAIKVHDRFDAYVRERGVYLRLRELGIDFICGSAVTPLLEYDDDLQAICMTMVHRPYILDFGDAFLGEPPEFSEDTMAERWAGRKNNVGDAFRTSPVFCNRSRSFGFTVLDVNPNNISWPPK
ncbi:MAG: hypothetical protein U0744_17985 [Gemmataceae bacterium]